MEHEVVKKESMHFIGITVRTQNDEAGGMMIAGVWDRFYREKIFLKIPNAVSEDFFGIYFDYAGDHTKPYSLLVGCQVSSLEDVPKGMAGHFVPAASYAHFPVLGAFPDNLIATWQKIWQSDLKRTYQTDIEQYGPQFRSRLPLVDIFVGIKP
ncbi:MAG: GyrI-like domain-containing protein [Chlamydiales bacterium]